MTYLNIQAVNPKLNKNLSVGDLVNRLLCYRETIINLKTRGYNWDRYDRKFRKYIETAKEPLFPYRMHDIAETGANTQSDRESFPSIFQKGRSKEDSSQQVTGHASTSKKGNVPTEQHANINIGAEKRQIRSWE